MKTFKTTFVLFLLGQALATSAQNNNQQPYLNKSFANAAIKNVNVKTSGGSITVSGGNASDAHVEVYINANNNNGEISKEELAERLKDYDLDVSISGNELEVSAKAKSNFNWKKSLSISFKIYVPKEVSTNLTTSGGSIKLSNLNGEQSFGTSGGSLNVNQLNGIVKGHTSGGSINVTNSKSNIDMRTSGGGINGDHISGELITGTSGGSINLTEMACSLETSTSAGSTHVQMDQLGKYIKINGSVGHIDLQIPSGKGLDLDLHGNRISTNVTTNFNGEKDDSRMVGKLNGGGIPVTVRTSIGGINLRM